MSETGFTSKQRKKIIYEREKQSVLLYKCVLLYIKCSPGCEDIYDPKNKFEHTLIYLSQ